jgi:hypothetical protein
MGGYKLTSFLNVIMLDEHSILREGFQLLLRKGGPMKTCNVCERVRGPLADILVPSYKIC